MAIGSIIPVAIDALVDIMRAQAGTAYEVFDGPGATDEAFRQALFIGLGSMDDLGFTTAANSDQEWAFLGHHQREEKASIACLATAWVGDTDSKVVRDIVFTILSEVMVKVQADPSLGGTVLQVVGVKAVQFKQNLNDKGSFAELSFDIDIRGRLN